ncbi:hypothetical protein Ccrd_013630, partial [Cynara cardunculus var. scolymus]
MFVISPMAKIFVRPLTLKFSSTINLPWPSKLSFRMVSLSHDDANGFPMHKKWQSARIVSPAEVEYALLPSETFSKSTVCSSFTSTWFDLSQSRVFLEAFGPRNSSNRLPLCTNVIFFSGKSTAISPASSTPVGPPPTIKIDSALFIFSFSAMINKAHM